MSRRARIRRVRRTLSPLLLVLLLACRGESPTAPPLQLSTNEEQPFFFNCDRVGGAVNPWIVDVLPGATRNVTVRVCYPPAGLPWTFDVGPPSIASGRATIPGGYSETVMQIRGNAKGTAIITYTVPNFGRAPATRQIGIVRVGEVSRQRSVAR